MKIVLLLFTLILIFLLIKKNREGFAFIPEANIDFLNKKTACGVLRSSKKYFEYLNKNDLEARQLIYYNASNLERPQTDSIIKHYCDNLLEFTIEEKDKIKSVINYIYRNISSKFLGYFKNWRFAKFSNSIENAYPHTHGDVVFLSQKLVDNLTEEYNNPLDITRISGLVDTLIHENIHILQRQYPKKFENLYTKYWDFKKVNEITGIENYLDNYRTNPDGLDLYYVFKNKIWLGCIYKTNTKKRMDMVYYYAVPVKKQTDKVFTLDETRDVENLTSNKEFSEFFNGIFSNYYHPNELAAEALAKYLTYDMNLNNSRNYTKNSPYVGRMETWIKKEL
jgi:hypothetical protein